MDSAFSFGNGKCVINTIKLVLTAAQVKLLNSVPQTIVAAQGAGTYLKLIDCIALLDYTAAAFTSTTLAVKNTTGAANQGITGSFLTSTADASASMLVTNTKDALIANEPLLLITNADSATGDGVLTVLITYAVYTPALA